MARRRLRRDSLKIDKEKVVARVIKFYDDDEQDMQDDLDARLQRYAKFRQWTEGRDWIGEMTSDAAVSDMAATSLRVQDTLHNAVMAVRPPVSAKSQKKQDKDKEEKIDRLIDAQVFIEQKGEAMIEQAVECFVNDGVVTYFVPWVKEKRDVVDLRIYDPIPPEAPPTEYFALLLTEEFRGAEFINDTGWDWRVVTEDEVFKVSFYTRDDDRVEMLIKRSADVFDGPKIIVKDYEDVLTPGRVENLQIPGPSNPGGSPHVILRDNPTVDEIKRLAKSKFYDFISKEDLGKLEGINQDISKDVAKIQKDDFQGRSKDSSDTPKSHKTLTRLTCFDMYDVDGDGIDEDVIFWVILETKTLLKAKLLTEMYPSIPPRRPFAESTFVPVKGRRVGISLLEMMEGLHDLTKQVIDQTVDAGTLGNAPFGFYRATSNVKQEVIRMWAGELYPLSDPKNDVNFPNLGNQSQSFGFNLIALLNQMTERLTNVGELQLGRVPQGKSSALRTLGGMQMILSQGEARPERILRRFFMGLTEVWAQIHELNQRFLPEKKKFRIAGYLKPHEDPYQEVTKRQEISGRFQFDFGANILNTSKQAMQASLNEMMASYLTPLAIQAGVINQDGIYNLLRDKGRSLGQDPDKYLTEPTPGARRPKLMAEEAIATIMDGAIPDGLPMEGAMEHFQKLQAFSESDDFGHLKGAAVEIFSQYLEDVRNLAAQEFQQQQLAQSAQQQQQQTAEQGGQPAPPAQEGNPPLNENELLDESLPGAGGLQ